MIQHTQIVLHLFFIQIFSDCTSLIISRIRIKLDCFTKLKRGLFGKVEEDAYETPLSLLETLTVFGEALFKCKPTVTLVWSPIESGKSLSTN